jgi:hypothetical protein
MGIFRFVEFILRDISNDELEKKGWYGVLEEYKKCMGGEEDFKRMKKELEEFIEESFRRD